MVLGYKNPAYYNDTIDNNMKDTDNKQRNIRDYLPQAVKKLNSIIRAWSDTAIVYGYEEYKSSIVENYSTFDKKTSREILESQTYKFKDRGGTEVLLRPEITPSLARIITSMGRSVKLPLRWFSIGQVFRYEREQKGRKRSHYQFNLDLIGVEDLWADAEVIEIAALTLDKLGLKKDDFCIEVNDKGVLESAFKKKNIPRTKMLEVFRRLDKSEKIEKEYEDILRTLQKNKPESVLYLEKMLPNLPIKYNPYLVRGFDYYTGIVFEILPVNSKYSFSIAGGGRYDNLIGNGKIPACGFGMGDVRLNEILEEKKLYKSMDDPSRIAAYNINQSVLNELRESNVKTALFTETKNQFKDAESKGFKYGLIFEKNQFVLRNLKTREDKKANLISEIIRMIK